MNNFYDWYKTIDHNDQAYLKAHEMNDYMLEAFNAGMERAAEIVESHEKLFTYNLVEKATKAIRKEIDND